MNHCNLSRYLDILYISVKITASYSDENHYYLNSKQVLTQNYEYGLGNGHIH